MADWVGRFPDWPGPSNGVILAATPQSLFRPKGPIARFEIELTFERSTPARPRSLGVTPADSPRSHEKCNHVNEALRSDTATRQAGQLHRLTIAGERDRVHRSYYCARMKPRQAVSCRKTPV